VELQVLTVGGKRRPFEARLVARLKPKPSRFRYRLAGTVRSVNAGPDLDIAVAEKLSAAFFFANVLRRRLPVWST
jgi:hypothetical protein